MLDLIICVTFLPVQNKYPVTRFIFQDFDKKWILLIKRYKYVYLGKWEFVDLTFLCTIDTGFTQASSDIITVLVRRAVTFFSTPTSKIIRLAFCGTVDTPKTHTFCKWIENEINKPNRIRNSFKLYVRLRWLDMRNN